MFDRPTRAERDFRLAMEVLKRPAPLSKAGLPLRKRVDAALAERRDIARAVATFDAVLRQIRGRYRDAGGQRDAAAAAH